MQIVIDIPEEMMSYINKNELNTISEAVYGCLAMLAIKTGTPLPKGHGRIGDLDRLYYVFEKNVVSADAFKELFDHAPTIIEADKEVQE